MQNQPTWHCRNLLGCSHCPPWQWQLLEGWALLLSLPGITPGLAAGRPIPASLSNCRDNCHKSNCSCWITSILHHHPQLPRASSELLFQGWRAAPVSQERPNQAGSGHLKQSPHAEGPLTAVPVCQAALLLCSCCSEYDELFVFWWCPWFWAMPLQAAGFVTGSPRCSFRQTCSMLPGHAASRDRSKCHPLPSRSGLDEAATWQELLTGH